MELAAAASLALALGVIFGIMLGAWLYSDRRMGRSRIVPEGMEAAVRRQQAELIRQMGAEARQAAL
jgi:hypothetical protein